DFMAAVGDLAKDPFLPVKLASSDQIESFSPPIFAAYCSRNGRVFISRLAQYKKLIGPMIFALTEDEASLSVELQTSKKEYRMPEFMVLSEFAFLTAMLRRASKEEIKPVEIELAIPLPENEEVREFFACPFKEGTENKITFAKEDLEKPFISYNQAMWDYFEPEMNKRLAALTVDDSVSAQVRSALTELLPSGEFMIDDVARKLGYSKRTLQRKLSAEKTNFQKQLNSTREILALHYLRNTDMTTNDIAYLLGYQELNSFLRAFAVWKGVSVSEYRKQIAEEE
ncbi:AraC family transcriptional regulator, partial [Lactobacillus nasalidis]